jgi:hypothetical protein
MVPGQEGSCPAGGVEGGVEGAQIELIAAAYAAACVDL